MSGRKPAILTKVLRSFIKSSKPVAAYRILLKVINAFPVFCTDLKIEDVETSAEERSRNYAVCST